jgi:CubicO group peptidase (beta-lactamase class C family)
VDTMHSFMLVRHGKVVAEAWWNPQTPQTEHVMYSLSKSFTSTAVGLAVAEGKMSVDDLVVKHFPGAPVPADAQHVQKLRVRDLLSMASGHAKEPRPPAGEVWTDYFFKMPLVHEPGTHFLYNSQATYLCSAILKKQTGQNLLEYLRPRLFEPLGIQANTWEESPQGIAIGGWGLYLKTEDIAKFGQLYLQKGKWNGKQIVPEAWVEQATSKQISNGSNPESDWSQGYGFQFWRCRNGAYRGDGAFGQFCIVMPEQDAVIAMTADSKDLQGQLRLVWDKVIPAFQKDVLPENAADLAAFREVAGKLAVRQDHKPGVIKLPGK